MSVAADSIGRDDKSRLWRLFIVGRSAVTGVFLALLVIITGFQITEEFRPLFLVAGVQFAANGMYFYLWKRRDLSFLGYLSLILEIALITLLILSFGPGGSLFVLAYLWPIIMGGWLIGRNAILLLTLLSSMAYGLLIILERQGLSLVTDLFPTTSTSLALFLCMPYLAFIALLVWAVTSEIERGEERLKLRNQQLHRANERLHDLVVTSEHFLSCLDMEELLRSATAQVTNLTGYSRSAIYINDGDQLMLRHHQNLSEPFCEERQIVPLPAEWLTPGDHASDVLKEAVGIPGSVGSAGRQIGHLPFVTHVALRSPHRLEGMLTIVPSDEEPIGQQEAQILRILGHLLGIALENARLFDDLEHDRNLLSGILSNMAEGVLVVDKQGEPILTNRSMWRVSGVEEGQSLPEPLLDEVARVLSSERVPDERHLVEYQGRAISLSIAELHVAEDVPQSTIFVARDVTEETQVQRMKSDFVAYASHEMRTPLTTTKMMTRLLMMDVAPDSKAHEYLSVINTQTDRQKRLINNLLDLARLEAGKFDLALDSVSPGQAVRSVIKACKPLADDKGIALDVADAGAPSEIMSNGVGLEQVLTNLVSNAIKFTDKGGRIAVECSQRNGSVEFRVADSGAGMTQEQLDRIFTKFYTVRNPRKHGEGTGLGLAISDMIVKQLGGEIRVTSHLGEGSCFAVSLPICTADAAD